MKRVEDNTSSMHLNYNESDTEMIRVDGHLSSMFSQGDLDTIIRQDLTDEEVNQMEA